MCSRTIYCETMELTFLMNLECSLVLRQVSFRMRDPPSVIDDSGGWSLTEDCLSPRIAGAFMFASSRLFRRGQRTRAQLYGSPVVGVCGTLERSQLAIPVYHKTD